jgi:PAS domain S-box-containing protein
MATHAMLHDQRSFEQLLQESDAPLLLLNREAVIQDINPPATRLLGGKREDYVGKEIFSLVDPADRYFLQEKWKDSSPGIQATRQFTVRLRKTEGPSDWHTLRVDAEDESLPGSVRLVHLEYLSTARGKK